MSLSREASVHRLVTTFVDGGPRRAVAYRAEIGDEVWEGGYHEADRFPSASTIKVAIAIAVQRKLLNGQLTSAKRVRPAELHESAYGSVMNIFSRDHQFTVDELNGIALATSDNLVVDYLLQLVPIVEVNRMLADLKLRNTFLAVGFEDRYLGPEGRRNLICAADALSLLRLLVEEPGMSPLLVAMVNGVRKCRIALRLPESIAVANKTGSLDGVAHDVAVIRDNDVCLYIAALTDQERDTAQTSMEIGTMALELWRCFGGRTE